MRSLFQLFIFSLIVLSVAHASLSDYRYYWQFNLSSNSSLTNYQQQIIANSSNFNFNDCNDFTQIAWSWVNTSGNGAERPTTGTILKISNQSLLVGYAIADNINGPNSSAIRLYCNYTGSGGAPNENNFTGTFPPPYITDDFSAANTSLWQDSGYGVSVSNGSTDEGPQTNLTAAFAMPLRLIIDMVPGPTISPDRPIIGFDEAGNYTAGVGSAQQPCAEISAGPYEEFNYFLWYTQNNTIGFDPTDPSFELALPGETFIGNSGHSTHFTPPPRAVYELGASPTDSYLSQSGNLVVSTQNQTCNSTSNQIVIGAGNDQSDNPTVYQVATAQYAWPPPAVYTTGQAFSNAIPFAHIILNEQVTNTHGGTAAPDDLGLLIDGNSVSSGSTTDVDSTLNHTISQTGLPGYSFVSISGDSACPSALGGSVSLGSGQTINCTISSADIAPALSVIEQVSNNYGGTASAASFTLSVNGTSASPSSFSGSASGTNVTLSAGSYAVSQSGPAGYASSFSSDCSGTINVGDGKTCTILSSDIQPQLTVNVAVQNSHGGNANASSFTVEVGNATVSPGAANGFNAGTYWVSESAVPGYSVHFSGACNSSGQVNLSVGDNKTCNVTSIDDVQASLTVTTVVVNDNGGTDVASQFPLYINGTSVTTGAPNTLPAGNYAVSQTVQTGYIANISGACNANGQVALPPGANASCTITDVDGVAPTLQVNTVVDNAYGGTLNASGVNLLVDGQSVTSGAAVSLSDGNHAVSQAAVSGYAYNVSGACASNGTVSLLPGDVKNCTVTDHDIEPTLAVTGVVINNNGGTANASSFTYKVGTATVSSGASNGFNAGSYLVSFSGPSGYSSAFSGACSAQGNVTLAIGNAKNCTITFNDIPAQLTVIKHVVNQNQFVCTQNRDDFDSQASRHGLSSPSSSDMNRILNLQDGGVISVQMGGNSYRVERYQGQIQVYDSNDDNRNGDEHHGGTITASSFTLSVNGTNVSTANFSGSENGTNVTLDAGAFNVSETGPAGYAPNFSANCSGNISIGQNKTCTLTNSFSATRDYGFWSSHFSLANSTWFGITNRTFCNKTVNTTGEFEGGLWASVNRKSNGQGRNSLDQDRMQLIEQIETAMLNVRYFGVSDGGLIAQAKADCLGTSDNAIEADTDALQSFNGGGASITSGIDSSSSNSNAAQSSATNSFWDTPS